MPALTALKRRFGGSEPCLGLQDQLRCQGRALGEKLGALATDIARLARQAYCDEPNSFSQWIALDTFLHSLQLLQLHHQVRLADPCTLDEAVNRALAIEAMLHNKEPLACHPTTQPVCSTYHAPEETPGYDHEHAPLLRVRPAAPSGARVRERVCWICGQLGHLMPDCRRLQPREISPPGPAGNE